jgi:hypothetical protein
MIERNHPYLSPALWEIIHSARRLALHAETTALLHGDETMARDLKYASHVLRQILIEERRLWDISDEEYDMERLRADKYQSGLNGAGPDPEAAAVFGK